MNAYTHIHINGDDEIVGSVYQSKESGVKMICLDCGERLTIFFKDDLAIKKTINELQNAVKQAQKTL